MTNTQRLAAWFTDRRNEYCDLIVAGRIFGGRHGESMQQPTEYDYDGTVLVVNFATTERLAVHSPSEFERGEHGQLIIPRGAKAVFGWHYYGRPQTPENWCEETYESVDDRIQLTRTGLLMPGTEDFQYDGDRFVELR